MIYVKVVLIGPMNGFDKLNRDMFNKVKAAHHERIGDSYQIDMITSIDIMDRLGLSENSDWNDRYIRGYMALNVLKHINNAAEVWVLPNWEQSKGTQIEVGFANNIGIPVISIFMED